MTDKAIIRGKRWGKIILLIFLSILGPCLGLMAIGLTLWFHYSNIMLGFLPIGIGVAAFLVFGIGRLFIRYDVIWGVPTGDMKVRFSLPLWKRIILLGIPLNLGRIKTEIRYRYGDMTGWTFPIDGDWVDENEVWIPLSKPTEKTLTVWVRSPDDSFFQASIPRIPLPKEFEFDVCLKTEDNKCLGRYTETYQKAT